MAVFSARIRAGLVLPLLIVTAVLMLVGHQAIGSTRVTGAVAAVSYVADDECAGNEPMHSRCCPGMALSAIGFQPCLYAPLDVLRPIDRQHSASATAGSRLYRPPRAA